MLLSHENLTKTIRDSNLSDLSGPTTLTLLLRVFVAYVKRFGLLGSFTSDKRYGFVNLLHCSWLSMKFA